MQNASYNSVREIVTLIHRFFPPTDTGWAPFQVTCGSSHSPQPKDNPWPFPVITLASFQGLLCLFIHWGSDGKCPELSDALKYWDGLGFSDKVKPKRSSKSQSTEKEENGAVMHREEEAWNTERRQWRAGASCASSEQTALHQEFRSSG